MLFALVLCSVIASATAHLRQFSLSAYVPSTQDAIVDKYFRRDLPDGKNSGKDEVVGVANNVTAEVTSEKSGNETNGPPTNTVSDVVWTGLLKNLLRNSYETTTYKYPTATWTAEHHEKLKQYRKQQLLKMPKLFVMKPSLLLRPVLGTGEEPPPAGRTPPKELGAVPKRGKVKWKDSRRKPGFDPKLARLGREEADRFLEQSLLRYLVSSNLIENIGNVSVETFSEILRNITRQKAEKRQFWPYDENKELRIKFRDEVFMKRKNESPSRRKFLEKQFQRRLERMNDYFSGKRKDKSGRNNSWEDAPATEAATFTTVATAKNEPSETDNPTLVRDLEPKANASEAPALWNETSPSGGVGGTGNGRTDSTPEELEELKLSVAETVYYKKRPFPVRTFSFEEEEAGVIPGIPEVDYPMYSSPPSTGFRCPKDIREQPKMMADPKTRCQVFYVCTGDGPAAAMLCPNGTMFNEEVRVCDWWYNVDC